jgi:outer membrane biosynthesis protein TonB
MKHCPKCTLDYADHFSFCEFDGSRLEKVSISKRKVILHPFSSGKIAEVALSLNWRILLQAVGIVILLFTGLLLIGKTNNRQVRASAANLSQPAAEPVFFETPQAARDYQENDDSESQQDTRQHPDKPGVMVIKPDTTDGKPGDPLPQDNTSQPNGKQKPELKRPQRTEINSPTVRPSEPVERSRTPQPEVEPEQATVPPPRAPQSRAPQPSSARPANSQVAVNRNTDFSASSGNSAIALSLVHVRSYRTAFGVRYELTLNMQHQGERLIRWERLTLATHSVSGINHSETIPFYQRLAASGSMNFTVSIEMRGNGNADLQGRLTCIAMGEDVDGRAVRTSFQTRVNSY